MFKRAIVTGLLLIVLHSGARAQTILDITTETSPASVGSVVTAEIDISGLTAGRALGTYDLSILFDGSILSFDGISFGNSLDVFGLGDIRSFTARANSVQLFELSLDSGPDLLGAQASSFQLATLTFTTVSVGTSPLSFDSVTLGDQAGLFILSENRNRFVSVISSPVPESDTYILMLLGAMPFLFRKWLSRGKLNPPLNSSAL